MVDDAADASLADDDEFQKWTEAAGDPGFLTAYLSPAAGPCWPTSSAVSAAR